MISLFRAQPGRFFPRTLRLTREGWWFCAVALGIGFGAMNTGNNLLYLLLGMLLSMIIASGVLSEVSLRGVTVKRLPPLRLHASHPFLMGISLHNCKRRFPSFSIEVEDLCDDKLLDKKCYFLKIPSGRTQQTSYRHTLPRRGRYIFTAFRVSTKFPFALFRKSRRIDHRSEVIVFPELLPLSHLPASVLSAVGELSKGKAARRGRFHGIREYRVDDDPRDIHWRSTARRGRLMVREYEEEAVRQVIIYVDNALDAEERRNEAAQRQVERVISWGASLTSVYLQHGFAVTLCARGEHALVPMCAGTHMLPHFLTMLALLPIVDPGIPFAALAGQRQAPTLDAMVIVRPGHRSQAHAGLGRVVEAA